MRNAPSVIYPVGRCAFYARLLLGLGGLGLLIGVLGWYSRDAGAGSLPAGLAGAGVWAIWAVFAWRSWMHSPVGSLQWDAQAATGDGTVRGGMWRWRSAGAQDGSPLLRVELALDLQSRVLLRLRNPDAASRWVWAERARDPVRWHDLRRALTMTRG